jgi:hypothetical protein
MMIEKNEGLRIKEQCEILDFAESNDYHQPQKESAENQQTLEIFG